MMECAAPAAAPWARPASRPPRETARPTPPAPGHEPTPAGAGACSTSRRASAPPGAPAPGRSHSSLAFARLSLFSSSWAAPWPRRWGPCLGRRDSHADQGAVATQFSSSTETGTSPDHLHFGIRFGAFGVAIGKYPPWLTGYLADEGFPGS